MWPILGLVARTENRGRWEMNGDLADVEVERYTLGWRSGEDEFMVVI